MKIIQSFWSKPFTARMQRHNLYDRSVGGYRNKKEFYMSMAYSALTISEYYPDLHLYTDQAGRQLLVEELGLPYKNVSTALDALDSVDPNLWAYGKIYTYSLQRQPFLHVDNDVFIYGPFDPKWLKSPVVAQCAEYQDAEVYEEVCRMILDKGLRIPQEMKHYVHNSGTLNGYSAFNAGVIGGNDMAFLKKYCEYATRLVTENGPRLSAAEAGMFNVFFEQSLLYVLSQHDGIQIDPLLKDFANCAESYVPIEFDLIPKTSYIHTVGPTKKADIVCEQVYIRMSRDYPAYFNKINEYCEVYA